MYRVKEYFDSEVFIFLFIDFSCESLLLSKFVKSLLFCAQGRLPNGQEIAVKRLLSVTVHGVEEFKTEIKLIAKLQHRNLVRLVGYCMKANEKILIYEYMPNGSLDSCLFGQSHFQILTINIT